MTSTITGATCAVAAGGLVVVTDDADHKNGKLKDRAYALALDERE